MSVIIETSIGDVIVDLYTDERPRCCLNFLKLCKIKYYNFTLFHTVQHNLVAQAGDPTAKGRGGESIFGHLYGEQARFFDMEVIPRILHSKKGLISMVNNGSGMHGSQFFFTLADSLDYLDGKHTVFGEVAEGMDIIDKLNNAFCDDEFRPHQDVRVYHTVILDDPYDDPKGLVVPSASPPPTQEMLDSDRIPCDADINEDDGKTEQELVEMQAERESKANTQLLEMVGDLPDADIAPPENVLFVCKLNPVTTSDDLEIIFSRFGNIVSCEVIKDQKTGESLQYAFVEFETEENCNNAYFKMDNVLIDDRRIHVDFSQSVSKLKWKGKGRGVEIQKDGDAPDYVLKNYERKSDGYDLVYAEDDLAAMASVREKKSKKVDRYDDEGKGARREKSDKASRQDFHEGRRGGRYEQSKGDGRRDQRDDRHRGRHKTGRDNRRDDSRSDSDRDSRRPSHPKHRSDERRQFNASKYPDDERHRRNDEQRKKYSYDVYDDRRQIKDGNKKSRRCHHSSDDSDSDEEKHRKQGGRRDRDDDDRRLIEDKNRADRRKRHHQSSDESDSEGERRYRKKEKKKRHERDDEQEKKSHKKKKKKTSKDYYSSDEDRRREKRRERY